MRQACRWGQRRLGVWWRWRGRWASAVRAGLTASLVFLGGGGLDGGHGAKLSLLGDLGHGYSSGPDDILGELSNGYEGELYEREMH
jgi:hypothetical protein